MPIVFPTPLDRNTRAALVVAHPGHELRLHGWLELVRPDVLILTDGSGSGRPSRFAWSSRLVEGVGAKLLSPTPRLTDAELYEAILGADRRLLLGLAAEVAELLQRAKVEYVVADAAEGYNPGHDLCRAIVDSALEIVARQGRALPGFEFPLNDNPGSCPPVLRNRAIWHTLDDATLQRKAQAAREYAALEAEVDNAIGRLGLEAFRIECLRPASPAAAAVAPGQTAFYESFGASRVAAGLYPTVLRQREHMAPLFEALEQFGRGH